MDANQKRQQGKHLDAMLSKEIASQIPTNVTRKSFAHILEHAKTENGLFACKLNGARINARMVFRTVYNFDSGLCEATNVPVAELFCSSCDPKPVTRKGEAVFNTELRTVSL